MAVGRKGRRPGNPDTRGQILDAASRGFATQGYENTTIRDVATAAGVDPALVLHYFGTKEELFIAALRFPVDPAAIIRSTLDETPPDDLGERLVATMLEAWDASTDRNPLIAVLRSVTGDESVAETVRHFVERSVIAAFAERLPGPEAPLRGTLIGSQVAGILLGRYVLRLEPLASTDAARLAAIYGPTIQRYAHGPLPPVVGRRGSTGWSPECRDSGAQ